MTEGRAYSPLGEIIIEIAARKNIRRPRTIENYIRERMGHSPTNVSITKWLHGDARPNPKLGHLQLFADAFDASEEDRARLAYADAFNEDLPDEFLADSASRSRG